MNNEELRGIWHDLNDCLNAVSTHAGMFTYKAKKHDFDNLGENALKEEFNKMLDLMKTFEDKSQKAGQLSKILKKEVYERLKIDTSKPLD